MEHDSAIAVTVGKSKGKTCLQQTHDHMVTLPKSEAAAGRRALRESTESIRSPMG